MPRRPTPSAIPVPSVPRPAGARSRLLPCPGMSCGWRRSAWGTAPATDPRHPAHRHAAAHATPCGTGGTVCPFGHWAFPERIVWWTCSAPARRRRRPGRPWALSQRGVGRHLAAGGWTVIGPACRPSRQELSAHGVGQWRSAQRRAAAWWRAAVHIVGRFGGTLGRRCPLRAPNLGSGAPPTPLPARFQQQCKSIQR